MKIEVTVTALITIEFEDDRVSNILDQAFDEVEGKLVHCGHPAYEVVSVVLGETIER